MLDINIKAQGLEAVRKLCERLSGPAMREAQAKAINDTAFQVRREMMRELKTAFDRPTPFIARSPKVVMATPDKLSATILPTVDTRNLPSKGGKVGVDPQQVLQAQEFGGRRADKRSEVALRRAGLLPAGFQTAIPKSPLPGTDDGRGNMRASFLVKLLSYLEAFGEQGYRANLTDKSAARRKTTEVFSNIQTRRKIRLMDGREYFISQGKASFKAGIESRSGDRMKIFEYTRRQNLAAGVWAREGKSLKPVLMFVRMPSYGPRISMQRIADKVDVDTYLARRLRFRLREAAGV